MTLITSTNTQTYTGDATTVAFSFPHLFFANADLVVTVDNVSKVLNTDYTVTGAGVAAGGTVTFTSAPASATSIVIQRIVSFIQDTDFENFDGNPADVTEKQFDLLAMQTQQNNEKVSRSILVPITTTLTSNTIAGTVDTTTRLLTLTTSGPATATVGSLTANFDVTLSGETTGDLLRYNGTDWSNVTQASLGLLTDVVGDTTPQLGGTLDTNSKQVRWSKGADVASANALTLGTDGNYFDITGTTTIVTIGTLAVGTVVKLHFDGILTLSHDGTDIILPGGANITTAAGDEAEFVEYATGDWRCTNYTKADGGVVSPAAAGGLILLGAYTASSDTSVDAYSGATELDVTIDSTHDEYIIECINVVPGTDNVDFFLRTSTDGGTSFDAGAGNYAHGFHGLKADASISIEAGGSNSDTEIALTQGVNLLGSAAGETYNCTIHLYKPSGTLYTCFEWTATYVDSGTNLNTFTGGGARLSAADVDGIRFLTSSGNIASGDFKIYGVKKS